MTEQSKTDSANITGTDRTMMVDVPAELGPYRMTRMLGRGGMGEVWQAMDIQLERDVAVKFMRKELIANEEAVKRFQREAKAVARLNHPNIVQVYSFGEQAGMVYFAMEMVEGETVTQRLKRMGRLPLEECVYILLQSIEGLSYANARGIVHRDIKPSNLMLTPDFRVKITDFGLAKMVEQDTQMTATGTSMGSPNYMSPEQARGQEADHRSDIYALGITFYQMLLNHLPFTADMPLTVLLKQIQEPLPEPDELKQLQEGRVLNLIKRMVEKEPDARFQTYGGLAAAMANLAPTVQVRSSTFTATASLPTPQELPRPTEAPIPQPMGVDFDLGNAPGDISTPPQEITLHHQAPRKPRKLSKPIIAALAIGGLAVVAGTFAAVKATLSYQSKPAATVTQDNPSSNVAVAEPTATPAPSPTTALAAPSPSPAVETATPVATVAVPVVVSPTAVVANVPPPSVIPPATIPTPAPVVPTAHTGAPVISPLNENPIPNVALPATPTPDPGQTITGLIIEKNGGTPGQAVELFNDRGDYIGLIPSGSRFARGQFQRVGDRYAIKYGNTTGYVKLLDGRYDYASGGSTAAAPAAIGSNIIVLVPAGGGTGDIPVYRDSSLGKELMKQRAGTEVEVLENGETKVRVMLPNGREGYVLKANTRPRQ